MTSEIQLGVYETFEGLHSRKSTLDELINEIRVFSQQSVLWTCAVFVAGLQLWDTLDSQPSDVHLHLLSLFFEGKLRTRLIAGFLGSKPRRVLFHRRQALLIAKLAMTHCPLHGINARTNPLLFAPILLKTNDQFDYGLLDRFSHKNWLVASRDDYAQVITEMLAVGEHSSPDVAALITRSHLMLTRFTEEMRGHSDFVAVADEYYKTTGLTLAEFEAMLLGAHSRFGMDLSRRLFDEPGVLPLKESNFATTAMPATKVAAFLDLLAAGPVKMAGELRVKDSGPNDFTVFRKFPLVRQFYDAHLKTAWCGYLMMDNAFFLEKVMAGPYWNANEVHGERLRRFWGPLFENYVNALMEQAFAPTHSRFISDPRLPHNQSVQICDGIVICGESIVLMEYKSNMFRADNKYSGNHVALATEIRKKLVEDSDSRSRKGVWQLSEAVKTLFGPKASDVLPGVNLSKIKNVYLYIITLDSIGGVMGISAFLNTFLTERLDRGEYPSIKIRPLFCSDIETLEIVTGLFAKMDLHQILERWLLFNPSLIAPLRATDLDWSLRRDNEWLRDGFNSTMKSVVKELFPGQGPGLALAEASRLAHQRRK